MKRSDLYIRIMTAVLLVAVLSYIGVYIYNAVSSTLATTTAIHYTVEQTISTQGYIVRTETVLTDVGIVVLPIVGEGEKVASGQAIAIEYLSGEALETASEIRSLRMMIAQIETSVGVEAAEAARLESVMGLSRAIQRGDLSRLDELLLDVETNIFVESYAQTADLPSMKARLELLEARDSGVRTIYAPVSGTFSQTVDGFEAIAPNALFDISPSSLEELFDTQPSVSGAGKLVTEFKWYYAAIMSVNEASRLSEDSQIPVQFSGAFYATMDMLVERIGRRDGDECVVLFSSTRNIHDIAPHRQLRADVVFDTVSGIRVPKEAIHLDDGVTFIYLQTGVRAEKVNVDILHEYGDSYLVRDGAESGTPLRVGSTIIVKGNNLFDGKVVGSKINVFLAGTE